LQLRVLGFGLLENGDVGVGVGVFPEGEEVSIGGERLSLSLKTVPNSLRLTSLECVQLRWTRRRLFETGFCPRQIMVARYKTF